MRKRSRILDPGSVPLVPGTRVVLQRRYDDEAGFLKPGTMGQVVRVEDGEVEVQTPAGRRFRVERDALAIQKRRVIERAAARQAGWDDFKDQIIFASVVGSQAWGLSERGSDQDVKGVFVLPFEDHAGFFRAPDEIHDPGGDAQYWEIEKLIHQALNADPNTLECLWSPLHIARSPLGELLLENRRIFVSQAIVGSFGRYALSQFKKIEKRLASGDPGRIARPKNAYNLIRLLLSALSWIGTGEPLIEVSGPERSELLSIKRGELPIEDVLKRGHELAAEVERRHNLYRVLPHRPDDEAAHRLLIACRRAAADEAAGSFHPSPSLPAGLLPSWAPPAQGPADPEALDLVVFDLDDTLFDCLEQCVGPAHREAAEAMRAAGLEAEVETIAALRREIRSADPSIPLEDAVCQRLGAEPSAAIRESGERAFFEREPGSLTPFPEVPSLIAALRARGASRLAIVTRGHAATQQKKIDALGIRELFDAVVVVDRETPKAAALAELLGDDDPKRALVVGDNRRDEVAAALALGMRACWIARGEFAEEARSAAWQPGSLAALLAWAKATRPEPS